MRCALAALVLVVTAATAAGAAKAPGAMPDSVLATMDGGRVVTMSTFTRGWRQMRPPARPDSLTPDGARQFLDLLLEKELLSEAASREKWAWTDRERAEYDALRDHLVIEAMLDSAMEVVRRDLKAHGYTTNDKDTLGIVARDNAMARVHATFDDTLCARLAQAWKALPRPSRDSSMFAQMRVLGAMPVVAPADTHRVVGRSDEGDYRVADLLHAWYHLNPLYRPRIETGAQVRDLVKNGLFERMLRRDAERRDVVDQGEIARQLRNQRELNDVTHYIDREVTAKVPLDSVTLYNFYRAHRSSWMLPLRVKVARLVLPDRASAMRMAVDLRNPGRADSLVSRARRGGLDWTGEITAQSDSALFDRAMRDGVGTVYGPDSIDTGWSVMRVMAVVPGRARSFDEVRTLVEHAWGGEGGEKRMRQVLADLRSRAHVRVNEPALKRLVDSPPPELMGAR